MDEKSLIAQVDGLVKDCQEHAAQDLVLHYAEEILTASAAELEARIAHRHSGEDLEPCADRLDTAVQASQIYLSSAEQAASSKALIEIEAALQRLQSGKFGFCVCCHQQIPAARLARVLTATMCIPCADERNHDDRRRV